ncbi:D-alanine--D-alanine ligase family protein [Actinokineospora inagensis]|uniref:D-alanine--D-alanine ligase family protein n=1 Tax=Actinokineospora inagensis TaxID=103730 RepID=UPI000478AFCB|nr:D-alanine--D-alanine ligase [Actinokineospora inagensis]
MRQRIRVAVIGGGQNVEHDVSRASAASARAALDPAKYEAVAFTIGRDGVWCDGDGRAFGVSPAGSLAGAMQALSTCDIVLPLLHGPLGEDGAIAALCELAGLPYVGSPPRAGALAMDKWATKLLAEALGVRTAPGTLVTSADEVAFERPVVVKPVAAGSSFGVRLVRSEAELRPAILAALEHDDRALVEHLVIGREIDIAVLDDPQGGPRTGPPLEIIVHNGLFDTVAKYSGGAKFVVPAPLSDHESALLTTAALRVYRALGCRGVARVDFFLTESGPILNEVNTMPGMTEASQLPKIFAAAGLSYPDLLDHLLQAATRIVST